MIAALVLGMELCWVSLALGLAWVAIAAGAWPFPLIGLLPAPLGLAAARLTPRAWRRRRWFDAYHWALALAATLPAVGLTWLATGGAGRVLLLVAAGPPLFWRGWSVGDDEPEAEGVVAGFQVGVVAVLLLPALAARSVPEAGLANVVGFFGLGLLAIGLARRAERRARGSGPERAWLPLALALGAATIVAASGLVGLVSPELLDVLAGQALAIATIVASVAASLLGALAALFGGLFAAGGSAGVPAGPPADLAAPRSPPEGFGVPDAALSPLQLLALAVAAVALAYVSYRLARAGLERAGSADWRVPTPRRGPPRAEGLSGAPAGWWRTLVALVLGWLRRPRGSVAGRSPGPTTEPSGEQRSIRGLYRDFLGATARLGLGRAPHQTPTEYAAQLAARRPDTAGALAALTRLYIRARYAEERLGGEEVAAMRAAVERATATLRDPPSTDVGR